MAANLAGVLNVFNFPDANSPPLLLDLTDFRSWLTYLINRLETLRSFKLLYDDAPEFNSAQLNSNYRRVFNHSLVHFSDAPVRQMVSKLSRLLRALHRAGVFTASELSEMKSECMSVTPRVYPNRQTFLNDTYIDINMQRGFNLTALHRGMRTQIQIESANAVNALTNVCTLNSSFLHLRVYPGAVPGLIANDSNLPTVQNGLIRVAIDGASHAVVMNGQIDFSYQVFTDIPTICNDSEIISGLTMCAADGIAPFGLIGVDVVSIFVQRMIYLIGYRGANHYSYTFNHAREIAITEFMVVKCLGMINEMHLLHR